MRSQTNIKDWGTGT